MSSFVDSLDVANRALDNLGKPHILDVNEDSLANSTIAGVYDKLREAELEGHIWRFAKRKVLLRPVTQTSRLLKPAQWNINETYLPGAIVSDVNGSIWISWLADNFGNEPGISDAWDAYYGPMAVDQWAPNVGYFAGELVWKQATFPGSFAIFMSTKFGNNDTPDVTTPWSATTVYGLNDRAFSGGSLWRSLITNNLNITPADIPNAYSSGTIYAAGNTVTASDGFVYTCVSNNTIGIDPTIDDGTFWTHGVAAAWSRVPAQFAASGNWLPLFSDMIDLGPEWQFAIPSNIISGQALNAFRFPAGVGRHARLGYRFRQGPDDYEPHGDYITSADAQILWEFMADIKDVRKMDAMFCEALAARIALATCKKLTGSEAALPNLASIYNKWILLAASVNGIEMGPEEPDEDEYLTVRTGGPGGFTSGATNWWN